MKRFIALVSITIAPMLMWGQSERVSDAHASNNRSWMITLTGGNIFSNGDLQSFEVDREEFDNGTGGFEFGFQLGIAKWLNPTYGIQGQVGYGTASGTRGAVHYETPLLDYNLNFLINFSNLVLTGKKKDRKWAWIGHAGVGMSRSQATRYVMDNVVAEYGVNTDDNWTDVPMMPVGLQGKYRISNLVDLDFGSQYRIYFHDLVDGVPAGSSNDANVYTYAGLSFNLGKKEEKAVFYRNPLDDMLASQEKMREDYDLLTNDSDGDGVSDMFDKEEDTEEGVAVDGAGRALDVDSDGIPDHMDEDPYSSKGAKVDSEGREEDSDGDGVPDSRDVEPDTKEGAMVNFQGKEIKASGGALSSAYLPQVYFAFNSATVDAANHRRLATVARVLKANSDVKVTVVGHTDKIGPEEYNKNLGKRRAEAVVKALTQTYGVSEDRLEVVSEGESKHAADGRNDVNRRVEFHFD